MSHVIRRTPVQYVNAAEEIKRIEAFVASMEQRYECDSASMERRLADGALCTEETSKWMAEWYILNRLRLAVGQEAG